MAAALDHNAAYGYQAPLWEMASDVLAKPRAISPEDQEQILETWPEYREPHGAAQTEFNAHYLLYGEPEKAIQLAELLFGLPLLDVPLGGMARFKWQPPADEEDGQG